jgi:hypothetical protein
VARDDDDRSVGGDGRERGAAPVEHDELEASSSATRLPGDVQVATPPPARLRSDGSRPWERP